MFRKQLMAGIDVGEDSLKYAVAEIYSGTVQYLCSLEILPERKEKDQIIGFERLNQKLAELIKTCQKEYHDFKHLVNTAVQGEEIISRYIELPPLTNEELEVAVPSIAIKYIPFPLEQITLSYIPVPQITSGKSKSAVFFVAAKKKITEEIKALFEKCGLQINKTEIPELALVREFYKNHKMPPRQFFALIHIGFKFTHTYAFQMSDQSSWKEAEQYKLNYDAIKREVSIEPFLMQWLDEVKKSFDFFSKQFPEKNQNIKMILLSGGTANLKNLDKCISEYLKIPVIIDTWNQIKPGNLKLSKLENNIYKIAIGLTLKNNY
ncbi:MAG: pilus assembly protein PilM [Armatimonadetes bacterium]|nr:pilus assembly protein PilM [Armatimonadota bacterium]